MQNSQQGWFLVEFVIRFVRKKIEFVIRLLGLYKTKKNCDVIKFIQTIRKKKERVHPSREPKCPTTLKLDRSRFQGICSGPTIGPGIAGPNVLSSGFRRNLLQLGTTGIQTSLLSATRRSRLVTHMPRLPQDCHRCKLVVLYLLITFYTLLQPQYQSGKRLM
jgi:hypothetical protein